MEKLNIIQKLAKIRAIADAVKKSKSGFNYSYADIVEILAKVTAGMNKYDVSLLPTIVPGTMQITPITFVDTKIDKTGKPYEKTTTELMVKADMVFRWIDNENTEDFIDVPWAVTGMQADPSQAFGSGLTYCTRYFLTNYFQIAQSDLDVDSYRSKQKEAEASEDRAIAEGVISQFDALLRQYLADNPDKSDEVKKFISRYEKKADYFKIKEPSLAAKLLADFKNKFINSEKADK